MKKHISLMVVLIMLCQAFCLAASADDTTLAQDMEALSLNSILKVPLAENGLLVDNLQLPSIGENGSTIQWSSDPAGIIDNKGNLTRPVEDTEVILTASLSDGESIAPLEKEFTFKVAGARTGAYEMPVINDSLYYDDFEDGQINGNTIDVSQDESGITEEGGTLNLNVGASKGATIYLKEDKSAATGKTVTEFIINRRASDTMVIEMLGNKTFAYVTWWDNSTNVLNFSHVDSTSGGSIANHVKASRDFDAVEKMKVSFYYDESKGTVSIWINNKLASEGLARPGTTFDRVYIHSSSKAIVTEIDDFHHYNAEIVLSDASISKKDCDSLERNAFLKAPIGESGLLVDNLKLPTAGLNGSTISWSSDPSGIISEDGTLVRPDTDTEVTLTASVTKGSYTNTKDFAFDVAGKNTRADEMPLVSETVFSDNFNDGEINSQIELKEAGATIREEDGALHLQRATASGESGANIYLNPDKSGQTGEIVTELIFNRSDSNTFSAQFYGADNKGLCYVTWWNNQITLSYADVQGGERKNYTFSSSPYNAASEMKLTVYFNPENSRIIFWINNKYSAMGYSLGAEDLSRVYIYNGNSGFDVTLDDFHCYKPDFELGASLACQIDSAKITEDTFYKVPKAHDTLVIDSLNLPTSGENGTEISWEASPAGIISTDGSLIERPASDTAVTLTATVSKGSASEEKTFSFTVAGKNTQVSDLPRIDEQIYYNGFSSASADSRIELVAGSGTAQIDNGVIYLEKSSISRKTGATIWLNENKSVATGKFVTEFILSRESQRQVSVDFIGENAQAALGISWGSKSDNVIVLTYPEVAGGEATDHRIKITDYNAEESLKVTLFADDSSNQFALWLNQEYIANGFFSTEDGISAVSIYNDGSAFDCSIDDFRYYTSALSSSADDVVDSDLNDLTESAILKAPKLSDGRIIDNLNLYTSGNKGSRISWHSSAPDVIDDKGNVTRQLDDRTVTVTATVSYLGDGTETKSFDFTVGGLSNPAENMPPLTAQAYYENFDDGVVDSKHLVLNDGNGMVREENGQLSIIKPTSSGISSAYIYPGENRGALTGKFVVEFTMTRKVQEVVSAQLYDSNGIFTIINWWKSSAGITLQYADEKGGARTSHNVSTGDYNATDRLKVTIYFDTYAQTCQIWLNNKYYDETGYSCGAKGLEWIYFYNDATTCNCTVDDFRYYYAQEDDETAVDLDIESLESYLKAGEINDGVLYKNVTLPTVGKYGSTIVWETSPESLLTPSGVINRPSTGSENPVVTITATVTSGQVQKQKTFTYKVASIESGDLSVLRKDAQLVELNSLLSQPELVDGYISHNLVLPAVGKYGSTISWESSDDSIITSTGKIVSYPETPSESTEVVLTATFTYGEATLTKDISVRVLPLSVADVRQSLPEVYESVYADDFSTDEFSVSNWFLRPQDTGIAERRDSKLEVTRTVNGDLETYARVYSDSSKDDINGLVGFEFDLEKNGSGEGIIRINSGTDRIKKILTTLTWQKSNRFTISYAPRKGSGSTTTETGVYTGNVKITGLVDTVRGTFSLWINGTIVLLDAYPSEASEEIGLLYVELALAKNNLISLYMDNLHYYYAKPHDFERTYFDSLKITEDTVLTKEPILEQTIDSNLNLPNLGFYGSNITWESSDSEIVNPDTGVVTRPEGVSENPLVTVTANIVYGDYITKKSFNFYVLRKLGEDEAYVDADLAYLTFENYDVFSFDDNDMSAIRTSLNLPSELAYGSEIIWSTSNKNVVTSSGRVTRGRWDEGAKTVTLTATVTYGNCTKTKEFILTVLPDEELLDPKYMSDEEFFGVWNGTEWTQEGKFNYAAYPAMTKIEEAVKAGDYEKAKEALLEYMKTRPESVINKSGGARNADFVDQMMLTGVWHYQGNRYYMGHGKVNNHEYEAVRFPIRTDLLIEGANSYRVAAKYNESSSVTIATKEHPNQDYRPKLEIVVNGQPFVYEAEADATIRGGEYSYTNYGSDSEMTVKMFGEFQGDETYAATIRFNIENLPAGTIDSAALILTAKLDQSFAESKELLINEEPSITWDESTIAWGRLEHYYFNVNGVPGGMDWLRAYPENCDSEFQQTHRFVMWPQILSEYIYTGDEKYAYTMIYNMMDYIIDSQFTISLSEWHKYQGGYKWSDFEELLISGTTNKNYGLKRRGGMPQLLTTSFRWAEWMTSFERLLDSRYMTPDVCTTLLKNLWDCSNEGDQYLYDYVLHQVEPKANNQWVFEANNIAQAVVFMPEFAEGEEWLVNMNDVLLFVKDAGYAEDGAYGEAANGYSANVIRAYISYVILADKAGLELPEGFADFVYDAVIYNEFLSRDPAGIAMSYGDSGYSRSLGRLLEDYEKLSKDETYLFLDSRGSEGVQPDWTSKQFASNSTTFMRSDWSRTALHLFTDCNAIGGGHGHSDDNAMRVSAYGEYLLIDPGMFSYEDTIYRRYGKSTRAHNTVEVDDQSQWRSATEANMKADLPGEVHEWSTNNQFDVLSQTTAGYENIGVDHRRTITFLKSGFWIVSDLMSPEDNTPHDYKQLWHMLPSSNQVINPAKGTIASDKDGANIIMASHDGIVTHSPEYDPSNPKQDDGWYTSRWGVYEYAPYAYYAKDDVVGAAGFDTVVLPYSTQGQGAASTEDIDLGVPVDVATAMKITTTVSGNKDETSYMLQYEPVIGTVRTFGEYQGDGMVNVVRCKEDGSIAELILNQGSTLRRADGSILLDTNGVDANIGLTVIGNSAIITTNDTEIDPADISFGVAKDVKNVMINGEYYKFTVTDGVVSIQNNTTGEVLEKDPSGSFGGVQGGGGSEKDDKDDKEESGKNEENKDPNTEPQPGDESVFVDIEGHWAEDGILRMAKKKIVQGDNGYFRPDDSISRAELVAMVVRALGIEATNVENPFDDVKAGSWYEQYVLVALDCGIISEDSIFRPDDSVTREEMSKILSVADSLYTQEEIYLEQDSTFSYADSDSISSWAIGYVNYATENGLMNGMDNNTFAPKSSATRAQVVTVIDRIFKE